MARTAEQFRQSDAALWGIVALVTCGIAVMGANISAVMPSNILGGLHRTRIEGASLEQLRAQVADFRQQLVELKSENGQLQTRFALEEQQNNEVVQRVGALEVSLPRLLEAMPNNPPIDRSTITSSIGDDQALVYDAEGGSVAIRQRPMQEAQPAVPAEQPLPASPAEQVAALPTPTGGFAVALGTPLAPEQAEAAWRDLSMKLGPLLFGLNPHVVDDGAGNQQIVVGPLPQLAEATELCGRVERISIPCMPREFGGTPLQTPPAAQ